MPSEFQWTDELVQEFADWLPVDTLAGKVQIEQFKQSKIKEKSTMPKKYRLLKDTLRSWPHMDYVVEAGETFNENGTMYIGEKTKWHFHKEFVENNPTWFEEIKTERIRVSVRYHWSVNDSRERAVIVCEQAIDSEKYPLIKQAIESILNNEGVRYSGEVHADFLDISTSEPFDKNNVKINGVKYSPKEDSQREKAEKLKEKINADFMDKIFEETKIKEWNVLDVEVTAPRQKLFVNGIEFVPQQSNNQPLSGELITKEECERREKRAFHGARFGMKRIEPASNISTFYPTYEDYQQSLK